MRVLILHSQVPFESGGAEVLVYGLRDALVERGHQADVVGLPLSWYPAERLLRSALAWRLLYVEEANGRPIDLVICTKFPTWAVKHPRKILWLVHQHRQAYDLYGTSVSDFGPGAEDQAIREAVVAVDNNGIGECERRYAISKNVAERLKRFNGLDAEVLYPPVEDRELRPDAYEPFVLSAARLDELKRIEAVIRAWPLVAEPLRLVVASDGPLRSRLEGLATSLGVSHRIDFVGRVPDEELARLFRECRAVYYAPVDEDYGYVTVEAHAAGKPVITSADAGGVLEFVQHGETGLVTELDPEPLAEAINAYQDEATARRHGMCGRERTRPNSWDDVVAALLGER